ncbi:ABC transporter permease [Rhizobium sp. RU36D]|uniref:ABC transporter permease n=1 Tax=Rhizobium sp. RU36D TaxID=1907415 RepID=UPI0009D85931|nr:ABC transporter permease [Rhizobium sp. RU36D]SMC70421.1 peptide/nickel transport system permease protein [Rhizobium sp. RU36D]
MIAYLIRRLGQSVLVLFTMAVLVFLAVFALGNPVDMLASPDADQAERAALAARFGLDQPLPVQFAAFITNMVQGDLGSSFVYGKSALAVIAERLPATIELAVLALSFSVAIGVPLGVVAGLWPRSIAGRAIMSTSIFGFSLPNFWIGLMLILFFAVYLGVLPAGGRGPTTEVLGMQLSILTWEGWRHLILPALTLALYKASLVVRLCEAGTREIMTQEYIRFARAKGIGRFRIIRLHLLKNMMIPVVTILGMEFGAMIAFTVVIETVFAYPGMGKLLIESINRLDRPVIVAYLMVTTVIFVVINFIVDLLYVALDPRVRLGGTSE